MNSPNKKLYEFGSFRLDPEEHILLYKDKIVSLTPKAFDTLLLLIENQGHVVDKDELLEQVWSDTVVEEGNIANNISQLRKILSQDGLENPFIETIPKRGYRFVAPVKKVESEPSEEEAVEKPSKLSFLRLSKQKIGIIIGIIPFLLIGARVWSYLPSFFESDAPSFEPNKISLITEDGRSYLGAISPDGKLAVFVSGQKDGKSKLVVRRIATGNTVEIVPPIDQPFFSAPTFSLDGEFIYYKVGEGTPTLYRVPVLGGPSKKLLVQIRSRVAISPDGNQIAFIRNGIVITDNNFKNLNKISIKEVGLLGLSHVLWSNDGQRLLVTGFKNAGDSGRKFSAVWVNKDDKTIIEAKELKPLIEQKWISISSLELLKDGSGIMFTGKKKGSDFSQIIHLSIPDGKITPVTSGTSNYNEISISDDGKTMVANKVDNAKDLISYNPETKEIKQILDKNKTFGGWISQMPDGKILVPKKTGEGRNIFRIDEDGRNEIQLTFNDRRNSLPIATPDGKYIVFKSIKQGESVQLWRMDADGSNQIQLTSGQGRLDGFDFTKDGQTIIFDRYSPGKKPGLMKISINGGKRTPLIPEVSPENTGAILPKVSPDGQSLAFKGGVFDLKTKKFQPEVYILSLKGDELGEIRNKFVLYGHGTKYRNAYEWTPDGRGLTFIKRSAGPSDLWNFDVDNGKPTKLTLFGSESDGVQSSTWANDGKKVFIVRVLRSQNVVLIN